jgi:hypothetical protein
MNIETSGGNAKWHVTAKSPRRSTTDLWFGYRQYTPTGVLARDHG